MRLKKTSEGKNTIRMSKFEWENIGKQSGWLTAKKKKKDEGWPKKLKKGRFTEYCKRHGFDGPCKACADKAMKSDDASVRGMASFYMNTVKP